MYRAPFPWGFAGSDVLECTHVQIELDGFSCETRARSVRAQTAACQTGAMEDYVRTLKTSEAAAVLNVSPNTLRAWERRFGYPKPQRTAGKHRLYTHGEVAALRDALQEGLSISSAISRARESLSADTSVLVGALQSFELDRADAAMEAALALRSVERSVEEVLLPSVNELGERHGFDSAPWAFAARWAADWLQRAQRLAPPPMRPAAVLIGDATRDDLDPDALALRALQLFAVRSGARVLVLPVTGVAGLVDVLRAFEPQVVVVAGGAAGGDQVARWGSRVRSTAGALQMTLFRRGPVERSRTAGRQLAESPGEAHRQILDLLDRRARHTEGPAHAATPPPPTRWPPPTPSRCCSPAAGEPTHEQATAARGAARLRRPRARPRLLRPLRPRRRDRHRRPRDARLPALRARAAHRRAAGARADAERPLPARRLDAVGLRHVGAGRGAAAGLGDGGGQPPRQRAARARRRRGLGPRRPRQPPDPRRPRRRRGARCRPAPDRRVRHPLLRPHRPVRPAARRAHGARRRRAPLRSAPR